MTTAQTKDLKAALAFLLPNFLGFLGFIAGPIVASLVVSFTSWDLLTAPKWVGWSNFVDLLGFHRTASGWMANDPDFWRFLGNTFFMMLSLPINMVGSLLLALILNQKIRFTSFYRLMFFLPSILAGVAIFYLWRFIYHSEYGLINALLEKIGLQGQRWLENPVLAKPSLMFMGLWIGMGGASMILYLAALQTIPRDLYEASRIDGADAWQRFWNITWPALHPITFFIFTMGVITGLQGGFESAFVMTNGGPYGATTTIGFYIYTRAYVFFQMGYASAIAWVLFLLTLIITLVNWKRAVARLVSV